LGLECEFDRRLDRNVRHGVGVITKVEWLTPLEEIEHQPKVIDRYGEEVNAPWYKVLSDSPGTVPENPLLAIAVRLAPGNAFAVATYRIPDEPFHASVAHFWHLDPDIYDRRKLMEHLLNKFHNRFHVLRRDPGDSGCQRWVDEETGEQGEGYSTVMHLDKDSDPIATDWWLSWAKQRGRRYHARPWHISL